jgi:predicted nuclease of predicted toxin-antitoxin system
MRFLLDANMPRSVVTVISSAGHEAEFAKDVGLGVAPDSRIAHYAMSTRSVLLTRDLDFANVMVYPPEQHAGIVVLRVADDMVAADIALVVKGFLERLTALGDLAGRLVILEKDRFRVRPSVAIL